VFELKHKKAAEAQVFDVTKVEEPDGATNTMTVDTLTPCVPPFAVAGVLCAKHHIVLLAAVGSEDTRTAFAALLDREGFSGAGKTPLFASPTLVKQVVAALSSPTCSVDTVLTALNDVPDDTLFGITIHTDASKREQQMYTSLVNFFYSSWVLLTDDEDGGAGVFQVGLFNSDRNQATVKFKIDMHATTSLPLKLVEHERTVRSVDHKLFPHQVLLLTCGQIGLCLRFGGPDVLAAIAVLFQIVAADLPGPLRSEFDVVRKVLGTDTCTATSALSYVSRLAA
jgi:hypothetical protein